MSHPHQLKENGSKQPRNYEQCMYNYKHAWPHKNSGAICLIGKTKISHRERNEGFLFISRNAS